ncbi:MAG TPA: BrnA antitoxin family protein [Stellaceae bacterium]|nr:BrnA antitoxin family protein [Stellaceae bacterium]
MSVKKDSSKQKYPSSADRPRTDWARVDALTDEEIEASVRDDPDAPPIVDAEWFATATLVMPRPKEQISIRLDRDVLEHFRRYPRYQTRINAILRAAMEHEKKAG